MSAGGVREPGSRFCDCSLRVRPERRQPGCRTPKNVGMPTIKVLLEVPYWNGSGRTLDRHKVAE